ncbi:MAG: phenylalanine 4-monooxygenase [Myxococcota bacterium]|nr:phenylalanine 4-monooxygenase [Myxococcota bacterium]
MRVVRQQGTGSNPAGQLRSLVHLNPDHPGFHDRAYRQRRDEIARIALDYEASTAVARIHYTPREHSVWHQVQHCLAPLHQRSVCSPLLEAARHLPLDSRSIPQLEDVNQLLLQHTGFRMEPVAGLVKPVVFLSYLGNRIFLSTQYIRHHSRPLYTPEPDVIHELTGHAASLAHPRIAEVSQAFGRAAMLADATELRRIEQVYWYTMEFGVLEEEGQVKAFGAGLLSSAGELAQFDRGPALLEWRLEDIAETPYDPTRMQPHLFVAPSFERMVDDLGQWLATGGWRSPRMRKAAG